MSVRENTARSPTTGPFAPTLPKTAEEDGGAEPMAVANDKANIHGESFLATSAPRDQWDKEVARKFGRPVEFARSDAESRAAQRPDGYTEPDENGWSKPQHDEA